MALSCIYRLVRRVVELLGILRLDDAARDAEILVLRHQLAAFAGRSPGPASPSLNRPIAMRLEDNETASIGIG